MEQPGRPLYERRSYYAELFHLTSKQRKHLSVELLDQLDKCQSDVARKLLINARQDSHEFRRNDNVDAR